MQFRQLRKYAYYSDEYVEVKNAKKEKIVLINMNYSFVDVIQHEQSRFQRAVSECTLEWSALSTEFDIEPKITERYSHSAAYHSGSMYIFGGCTATGTTFNDLWRFDLGTRHWIRPLATGMFHLICCILRIYYHPIVYLSFI